MWPEFEVWLSDQEVFDLIDEFADEEPHSLPLEIRALGAARTGAWASGDRPGPATFTKPAAPDSVAAATPRAAGQSPSSHVQQRDARGVHNLTLYQLSHRNADCHREEAAAGWLNGSFVCHRCASDMESPRGAALPGA